MQDKKWLIPRSSRKTINAVVASIWIYITGVSICLFMLSSMTVHCKNHINTYDPIQEAQDKNALIVGENIFWQGWAGLPTPSYKKGRRKDTSYQAGALLRTGLTSAEISQRISAMQQFRQLIYETKLDMRPYVASQEIPDLYAKVQKLIDKQTTPEKLMKKPLPMPKVPQPTSHRFWMYLPAVILFLAGTASAIYTRFIVGSASLFFSRENIWWLIIGNVGTILVAIADFVWLILRGTFSLPATLWRGITHFNFGYFCYPVIRGLKTYLHLHYDPAIKKGKHHNWQIARTIKGLKNRRQKVQFALRYNPWDFNALAMQQTLDEMIGRLEELFVDDEQTQQIASDSALAQEVAKEVDNAERLKIQQELDLRVQ